MNTEIHILIGSEDVKVDSSVNQSDGANAQGRNRFQRAKNFFNVATDIAVSYTHLTLPTKRIV